MDDQGAPMSTESDQRHDQRTPTDVLVRSAATGDEAAWQELVLRYVALVCAICRRCHLCEADTAHVTRVVLTRALGHLSELTGPGALPAWVAATTRRECLHLVLRAADEVEFADAQN
jgi:DNA-directed RNA polymerase specialized sigma24 family protein